MMGSDSDLNYAINYNPGNRNQQRLLLEKIGAKALQATVDQLGYDPLDYDNTSANRNRRLALERAIIADDMNAVGDQIDGYSPMELQEIKRKYGKRAFR